MFQFSSARQDRGVQRTLSVVIITLSVKMASVSVWRPSTTSTASVVSNNLNRSSINYKVCLVCINVSKQTPVCPYSQGKFQRSTFINFALYTFVLLWPKLLPNSGYVSYE